MKSFVGFFNDYSHAWMTPKSSKSAREQQIILHVFPWDYGLNIYLTL